MNLIQLVYVSEGLPGMPWEQLRRILLEANASNARRSITGLLCYGSGLFLQVLEGEREAVNALYRSIQQDPRHAHCQLLRVDDIRTRDFAEWSMKYIGWDDVATAHRRALLLRHTDSEVFDPRRLRGQQSLDFLRDLARQELTTSIPESTAA